MANKKPLTRWGFFRLAIDCFNYSRSIKGVQKYLQDANKILLNPTYISDLYHAKVFIFVLGRGKLKYS